MDAGVCIQAHDRAALDRLLRYGAHPPFVCERLRKEGIALVYRCATQTGEILNYIGMDSEPPHIAPARGPPLWDDCDARIGEGITPEPDWATDWDGAAQAAPDFEVDHRISW